MKEQSRFQIFSSSFFCDKNAKSRDELHRLRGRYALTVSQSQAKPVLLIVRYVIWDMGDSAVCFCVAQSRRAESGDEERVFDDQLCTWRQGGTSNHLTRIQIYVFPS
jgi:hypothetical protein